jgi:antitoxin CptB
MTDDIEIRRHRAAYRACHRGTKEMDLILGRFAQARLSRMTLQALDDFERLLALPDPLLTQWFHAGGGPEEAALAAFIDALRSYHGLAAMPVEGPKQA